MSTTTLDGGRFIQVPASMLPVDTLNALLDVFVTREGYDTSDTSDAGTRGWTAQLQARLERGELMIVHDLETESTEVMTREQWEAFGRQAFDDEED
ncbi:YheU family protein [Larsenimonas rhizosphaerae]|uniref:YheU family protein n=1 Tax=Larsenimonas rhizosphaerae TaxID=2944682 RepID=A0AA42CWK3_9GAMM|nr:YheU family protein [Larsenimonas rhizosphaerae]MCX2522710.1 YheU family protein [Larsenimonas rhizosphaerae]